MGKGRVKFRPAGKQLMGANRLGRRGPTPDQQKEIERLSNPKTSQDLIDALNNPATPAFKQMLNIIIARKMEINLLDAIIERTFIQQIKASEAEKSGIYKAMMMKEKEDQEKSREIAADFFSQVEQKRLRELELQQIKAMDPSSIPALYQQKKSELNQLSKDISGLQSELKNHEAKNKVLGEVKNKLYTDFNERASKKNEVITTALTNAGLKYSILNDKGVFELVDANDRRFQEILKIRGSSPDEKRILLIRAAILQQGNTPVPLPVLDELKANSTLFDDRLTKVIVKLKLQEQPLNPSDAKKLEDLETVRANVRAASAGLSAPDAAARQNQILIDLSIAEARIRDILANNKEDKFLSEKVMVSLTNLSATMERARGAASTPTPEAASVLKAAPETAQADAHETAKAAVPPPPPLPAASAPPPPPPPLPRNKKQVGETVAEMESKMSGYVNQAKSKFEALKANEQFMQNTYTDLRVTTNQLTDLTKGMTDILEARLQQLKQEQPLTEQNARIVAGLEPMIAKLKSALAEVADANKLLLSTNVESNRQTIVERLIPATDNVKSALIDLSELSPELKSGKNDPMLEQLDAKTGQIKTSIKKLYKLGGDIEKTFLDMYHKNEKANAPVERKIDEVEAANPDAQKKQDVGNIVAAVIDKKESDDHGDNLTNQLADKTNQEKKVQAEIELLEQTHKYNGGDPTELQSTKAEEKHPSMMLGKSGSSDT